MSNSSSDLKVSISHILLASINYRTSRDLKKTPKANKSPQLDERLQKTGMKTHKQRVEELNKYLSNLSEHHDMYVLSPALFIFRFFPFKLIAKSLILTFYFFLL